IIPSRLNIVKVNSTGTTWKNESPDELAPSGIQKHSAWAFVVSGRLLDDSGGNYTAIVKNLSTGAVVTEAIKPGGYFAAAWADLSRNSVVESGDAIEITVVDLYGSVVSGPYVHQVTLDSIRNALMNVQLRLGHIIPKESALLQNYPNPFNPETWIPYQLAEDSVVIVRIYSSTGQLIRTVDLGHKEAGSYVTKDAAVHWDGVTDAGEHVASGIYFYNIQAGGYNATRKMVVAK
ncbi:FlgD immunoglobulin-like domain containing protein, partial [Candidatus Poribacteria bacterium]